MATVMIHITDTDDRPQVTVWWERNVLKHGFRSRAEQEAGGMLGSLPDDVLGYARNVHGDQD